MPGDQVGELRDRLSDELRAQRVSLDALDDAAAAYLGVNRTDLRCLDVLLRLGAATPTRLGTLLGLSTGSVTVMLDRLAKLGYLTRAPDAGDRRKIVVRPTELAGTEAARVYRPLAEEEAAAVAGYTAAELTLLIDHLTRARERHERHRARIEAMRPRPQRRPRP